MSGDRLETYTAVQHWLGISMHRLYFTNHWDFLWHIAWEVLYWKKGVCIMWGPSIHTYGAERGLPWAELGCLFYNFLLSIGSSFNGIIPQPHSSKNKLRRKCILGPMIGKIKGKGGTQGRWQAGGFSRGLSLTACVLQAPVGLWGLITHASFLAPRQSSFSCLLSMYKCRLKSAIFSTHLYSFSIVNNFMFQGRFFYWTF